MIEKAVQKIKDEMSKSKNPYMKVVGKYVLSQIEINPNSVKEVVDGNKTLKGSLKEMENVARKRAVDRVGILTDEEGFAIVAKYFGFKAFQDKMLKVEVSEIKEECKIAEEHNNNVSFKVNLKDLL